MRDKWAVALLASCLILPSTALIQRLSGPGVFVYPVVAALVVRQIYRRLPALAARISERRAWLLAAATFAALAIAFWIVFPIADSGRLGGGSDGDDALNLAGGRLLRGEYPYDVRTYLGNAITPLPGALLLALPFVLAGESAYQTLFWLAIFFLFVRRLTGTASALLLAWTIFVVSPVTLSLTLAGTDTLANAIYVTVCALTMLAAISRDDRLAGMLSAAALGVALSSRVNYLLLVPLIFAAAVRSAGVKRGAQHLAVCAAAFVAITLPFYLWEPRGFIPLDAQLGKLTRFERVVPLAVPVVEAATAAAAVLIAVLCLRRRISPRQTVLTGGAIVQAIPVVAAVALHSLAVRDLRFDWAAYGVPSLVLGSLAAWPVTRRPAPGSRSACVP
jgi:hypothetical protein